MPTRIHLGPDFEDFTMTSENFRWLHSCRWEAAHSLAFVALFNRSAHSLAKAPNLVKIKNFESPLTSARWLLVDEEEETLAWAELQAFPSRHDKFGILLWGLSPKTQDFRDVHITRLISFCLIVGKFDHMKIAASDAPGQKFLDGIAAQVGEMRKTLVFRANAWYPSKLDPTMELTTLEIAREEWVASPVSDHKNNTLQMVSARISRFEKAQAMLAPKQKRRGILARLLRPKVDDTLF